MSKRKKATRETFEKALAKVPPGTEVIWGSDSRGGYEAKLDIWQSSDGGPDMLVVLPADAREPKELPPYEYDVKAVLKNLRTWFDEQGERDLTPTEHILLGHLKRIETRGVDPEVFLVSPYARSASWTDF